jgi:hypothetical protein
VPRTHDLQRNTCSKRQKCHQTEKQSLFPQRLQPFRSTIIASRKKKVMAMTRGRHFASVVCARLRADQR